MKSMKELNNEERPYEKCITYGPENLTNRELLAVILRTGTKGENALQLAEKVLCPEFGEAGLLNIHQWSMEQLLEVKGIGTVKAVQILCLSELSKRLAKTTAGLELDFHSPATIARYYMEDMRHKQQEYMKLLLLNTKTHLIGELDVAKGTVNAAVISPRELFIEALKRNAVSIILLHNHPSGDPTPSKEDIEITRQICNAGMIIGIELLDHIIIGDNRYISLREKRYFG